ncbi:acyl carrier protein [Massilia yuzhufengensis]|uniref:Acyl carrier protein n=1 Tax=Massilia yuzhufengensis TaxID=1164594 RepID=A0A1I1G4H5_9BURK|nr:acyl carrier protein [Massilia yuzhufengensis]SFC06647.1 acyl carrier protein [Massilia yuzhufengensis]
MSTFYEGMAEIFEVEPAAITPEFDLTTAEAQWDSLALVSTIALVDDCYNVMLDGTALAACRTIGDIEALVRQAKG